MSDRNGTTLSPGDPVLYHHDDETVLCATVLRPVGEWDDDFDDDELEELPFRYCDECGGQPTVHPVRHIGLGSESACVDEGMVELVLACWDRGIRTTESCQGDDDDDAFLSFDRVEDFVRFATLVIEGGPCDDTFIAAVERWRWDVLPLDAAWTDHEMPTPDIPPVAGFLPCVNIPVEDVPHTVQRLRARVE